MQDPLSPLIPPRVNVKRPPLSGAPLFGRALNSGDGECGRSGGKWDASLADARRGPVLSFCMQPRNLQR